MKRNPVLLATLVIPLLFGNHSIQAADLVWVGATGNWNAAGNWSPAQVPTAADNVWITNNGSYTVTLPAGSSGTAGGLVLGGPGGSQTLAIDRATLTLDGPGLIHANGQLTLLVSQSVLTGTGNLTVEGSIDWPNGSISGTGALSISAGGVLSIGSGGVNLGRTLNNGGTCSWSGGNFTVSAGNALNNLAGARFDITADGRLTGASTTPVNNAGLLRLTSGTTGTIVTAPLNNSGTVQVLASTLNLNLGGIHTGTFDISSTLNMGGGSHVLSGGSVIAGTGSLSVGGSAALTASGTFNAGTTLNVASGIATLTASSDVTAANLSITGNGGVLVFNSSGTAASVTASAGTLGGASPIVVTGALTLGGGTVTNGLVTAGGGLLVLGNTTLNGTKLINPQTAVWSAGNISGANGASISNLLGATFLNTFDGNMTTGAGATPLFVNSGTFAKTNGTAALGATSIDFQFLNTGTVEVRTNTLRYALNQQTAGLTLLDGGSLSAQAQPIQIFGGSLMGTGLVTVANLQNLVNSSSLTPGLPLGELDITGNYQQTSSGVLNIELGGYSPGTNSDLVTVSAGGAGGAATLGGTLNVALAPGFAPTNGATFTFLKAASRVGTFAGFNYPSNDIGMQLSYDSTSATLKVTNLKPSVANPIIGPDPAIYGAPFTFQFPANTFADPDGDVLTYTAAGLPAGITFNASTRVFSGTPAQTGRFAVAVTATDNGIPNLSVTNTFSLVVDPATLAVTADVLTRTYGAADPPLTYTATGFANGDNAATVLSGALARAPGEGVAGSPYPISRGTLTANSNYVITFTPGTLVVTTAPLVISADPKAKTYGAIDPPFTASYAGFVNGETPAVLTGTLVLTRAAGQTVGSYNISPAGLGSADYAINFKSGTLTITPAPLSITAENKSKIYGASDPGFSALYSGLLNGDTPSSLGGTLTFSRAPGESVGSYAITPNGLADPNYQISFNPGTLAITKADLSVTVSQRTKTYGHPDPELTFTVTGLQFADTVISVLTGALIRDVGETVAGSPYAIRQGTLSANGNYTLLFTGNSLSVTPATLTITAQPKAKVYGSADPALTFTASGFQFSDTPSSVLSGSITRTGGEHVSASPYPITRGTLAANNNYTIDFTDSALSITPAPLLVTVLDATRAYGQTNPVFAVTFSGFVNGETNNVLGGTLLLTTLADTNSPVGNYAISGSGLTSIDYSIAYSEGNLAVLPHALTVTAEDKSQVYGAGDPAFTATYIGFVNGDSVASLVGSLAFNRAPGQNVGSYSVTPSGLISTNYAITFRPGTLTIQPALLTVVANAQTKTYGNADPPLTFAATGFQFADTATSVLAGALDRVAGETVVGGPYGITQGTLAAGSNYIVHFTSSSLTITPAALSITAEPATKTYGQTDPAFAVSYSGFVRGETPAALAGALSFTRTAGENAGTYNIMPGGLSSDNYTITFNPGVLTIIRAALAITAEAKTKTYGSADPLFTVTYGGLANGDTGSILSGTLSIARSPGEDAGVYSLTPGGVTSANYNITFIAATLVVLKAPLSVTADSKTKTYGTIDPPFTVSYAGFVRGETSASLGGALSIVRATGEAVGSYQITPGGLTSANYSISFNPGTLTIVKAALLVAANNQTKTYGAVDPAPTVTYTGFVNGETPAILAGALTFSRVPGENVGAYLITPAGLTSSSYDIRFSQGTLTIIQAPLAVAADPKTKTYGAADPALTFTATGFQFADTQSAVLSGALARTPGETVAGGPYPITRGTLAATANYSINFTAANLAITPAHLFVTANSTTKTYGAADPAFTVTYAGFVNGDTAAGLSGTLNMQRVPGETVGSYLITPGGLASSNYAITFNTGLLTIIAPAPVLLPLTISLTGQVGITWTSISNATYRVQFKTDLNAQTWTDLPGDVLASSTTASKTDTLAGTHRFYRVQVVP